MHEDEERFAYHDEGQSRGRPSPHILGIFSRLHRSAPVADFNFECCCDQRISSSAVVRIAGMTKYTLHEVVGIDVLNICSADLKLAPNWQLDVGHTGG